MALTMKTAVFWDMTPCTSFNNRCVGGTFRLYHQVAISELGITLAVTSNRNTLLVDYSQADGGEMFL
jgi:hypothetical protein